MGNNFFDENDQEAHGSMLQLDSESQCRPLWERLPGIVLIQGANGEIIFQNSAFKLLSNPHPVLELCWGVIGTGVSSSIEFSERKKEEPEVWYQCAANIVRDEQGAVIAAIAQGLDITERKRSEELLENVGVSLISSIDPESVLPNLARCLVGYLADWCFIGIVDEKGALRLSATAHSIQEKAKLLSELEHCMPDADAPNGLPRAMRTREPMIYSDITEDSLQTSEGKWPVFGTRNEATLKVIRELGARSYMAVPMLARGKILGAIMFVSDSNPHRYGEKELHLAKEIAHRAALGIDNTVLYQDAQEAILRREEFMSIASHELKTPLTSLKMQLQMLGRLIPKAKNLEKLIHSADQQILRLTRLVDDMLDVTRLSSGSLSLALEDTELTELVRDVLERFHSQISAANCEVEVQVQGEVFGRWDRFRLEQVVINLLMNAIKYGSGNPVQISVSKIGEHALFTVRDFGIGIAKEDQARIFDRFERAVSLKSFGGMGLGLYITRQIVLAHGGSIRVESEPGDGSCFTVDLPLRAMEIRNESAA